ncbi:MAG: isopenicillin N synthase family oxygenase [Bacteroidetes bacterium]|nr:isopenicillin N synthase family oxygenase [Bacteroidota bacterium]
MAEILYDTIPSFDLNNFTNGDAQSKKQFAQAIGEAYHNIGFIAVKNHGFSEDLQDNLYKSIKEFFALPQNIKEQYDGTKTHGQRGYTGKMREHAAGRKIGDLKEFYHIGRSIPNHESSHYQENILPKETPDFGAYTLQTYEQLEKVGRTLLKAMAIYLEQDENYFENKVDKGISILRPIHYYPLTQEESVSGAVRAAEHGDINLITILMGASAEGLEVKRQDGKWIPITAVPEQLVVNVGDMLERLTNGKLRSTHHRVVNPPSAKAGMPRYSIPFFMHGNPDMSLKVLDSCVDANHPKKFEDATVEEFLMQRLREIGLAK